MKLISLALILFTVSCSSILPSHDTQLHKISVSNSLPSPTPPLPSPTPISNSSQDMAIRSIDFRNFTYEWAPKWVRSPKIKHIVLKDGNKEAGELNGRITTPGFDLMNVTYGDLTGDNSEEAVVTLVIDTGGISAFAHVVLIYTLRNHKAKLLWVHETGDRADGGIRNLYIDNGNLVIEQYYLDKVVIDGDELAPTGQCCPKSFTRSYYKWNGRSFDKTNSQMMKNEFGNARILLGAHR